MTQAIIAVRDNNFPNIFRYVWVHCDGGIKWTGAILRSFHNDKDKARKIVEMGPLRFLSVYLDLPKGEPMSSALTETEKWADWDGMDEYADDLENLARSVPYVYLWDDGVSGWVLAYEHGAKRFQPLAERVPEHTFGYERVAYEHVSSVRIDGTKIVFKSVRQKKPTFFQRLCETFSIHRLF